MKLKMDKKHRREITNALAMLTQVGLTLFFTVFISIMIGKGLDGWLHTEPWFLLIFTILGILAAFRNLYDLVMKKWM